MTCLKYSYIALFISGLVFGCTGHIHAQTLQEKTPDLEELSNNTRIWTGTVGIRWYNYYTLVYGEVQEISRTRLDVKFQHFWLMNQRFGLGVQGMSELLMREFFGDLTIGNVGVGPTLRLFPIKSKRWQPYVQGGILIGYDLALSDAFGSNRNEGIRYRPGMRVGITYRVSNNFGIYMEVGPDWEGDQAFEIDSRALQFDFGIQVLRF